MSTPTEDATSVGTACYVYGVVTTDVGAPSDLAGVGRPAGEVTLLPHEGLAAVVSAVNPDRPLGTRHDLLAHERVLDTMVTAGPVLPMRFGAVLADEEAVVAELLAAHYDDFTETLEDLRGHAQLTVKGRYVQDAVLREVLAEEPEVLRLRERLQGVSEDAGYYDRIRLGELVSHAVATKREADEAVLIETLTPHVASLSVHEPAGNEGAFDVAFLVEDSRRARYEEAVEELGRQWSGRIQMSLLGPLAPYDFVDPGED